ncbi:MAG: prepilin-type N-terminal cleavage/methylation domain-containing protein [Cellulosilyticaceae bacterium]
MLNLNPFSRRGPQCKGLSLVEVLVVVALIGMMSLLILQMMGAGGGVVATHQKQMDRSSNALVLEQVIKERLGFAGEAKIIGKREYPLEQQVFFEDLQDLRVGEEALVHYYIAKENELIYAMYETNGQLVECHTLAMPYPIRVQFKQVKGYPYLIEVDVFLEEEEVFTTQVELMNFLANQTIKGNTEGQSILWITKK